MATDKPRSVAQYAIIALILAFALRIFLMPITAHSDLFFIHHFPFFLSFHGVWDVYGYFADQYLSRGYTYYPPLTYFLTASSQLPLRVINPDFFIMMSSYHQSTLLDDAKWFLEGFNGIPLVSRLWSIFLMKWHYLAVDIGILGLISILFRAQSAQKLRIAQMMWFCSPIVIFSTYIFGQFRVLSAGLMWLVILCISKRRNNLAIIILSTIGLMENYAWLLLPPLILITERTALKRIGLIFMAMLPPLAILLPMTFHSQGYVLHAYYSPIIMDAATGSLFRSGSVELAWLMKMVLGGGYLVLLWRLFRYNASSAKDDALITWTFSSCIVLLLIFATSKASIHYFMWIMPFVVYLMAEGKWRYQYRLWVLIILLFFFNLDSKALNLGLLMPLGPKAWLSFSSLHDVMSLYLPWGKLIAISRLIFTAICLQISWLMLFNININQNELNRRVL